MGSTVLDGVTAFTRAIHFSKTPPMPGGEKGTNSKPLALVVTFVLRASHAGDLGVAWKWGQKPESAQGVPSGCPAEWEWKCK